MHTLTGFDYEFMQLKRREGETNFEQGYLANDPKTFYICTWRELVSAGLVWSDLNHKNMIT